VTDGGKQNVKRVLVIENDPEAPVGLLGRIMEEQRIAYDVVQAGRSEIPDTADTYAALIVLGGPQHVGDDESYPYFVAEEALIRDSIVKDIAYLGICLGGQLLAHALGAAVEPHRMFEAGFSRVELTSEGLSDPLYRSLPRTQLVFQWHVDAFALPQSATLLATGADTPYQAFRYGAKAYGLQYHIEMLPETFAFWLQADSRELEEALGPDAIPRLHDDWENHYTSYCRQSAIMFGNFLRLAGFPAPPKLSVSRELETVQQVQYDSI
jgi:GMP synthase (glutamine-hydrolysing)